MRAVSEMQRCNGLDGCPGASLLCCGRPKLRLAVGVGGFLASKAPAPSDGPQLRF